MKSTFLVELQYFPNIEYVCKWLTYQKVVLEQWENYTKGSYRNRCHIATANGVQRLSVPLRKGKNEQQQIRDVQVAYHEPWQTKYWQAIRSAYRNAPFFEFYEADIAPFFEKKYRFLWDMNLEILEVLFSLIGLDTDVAFSESYQKELPQDWEDGRNRISPKTNGNAPFFKAIAYPQVFEDKNGFTPNVSVLDVLFCKGPETLLYLKGTSPTNSMQ